MPPTIPRDEHDNPLAPMSSRFAIGRMPSAADEASSGATTRPFGLRFTQPAPDVDGLPAHRYCRDRQVSVDATTGQPLIGYDRTTIGVKDGHGGGQEDWKPDL